MIVLKGNGHPDEVAKTLSEVAINALNEYNPKLYGNFDKSYIKAGRFPEFVVAGDLSFDFNEYDISYRHDMESFISDKIKKKFREIFPKCGMNVKFNLGLYPNDKQQIREEFHDRSSVIFKSGELSQLELVTIKLSEYLVTNSEKYNLGNDYDITLTSDTIVINQSFIGEYNDDKYLESNYDDLLKSFVELVEHFYIDETQKPLCVNPTPISMNKFGSRLFVNKSGFCGKGNGPEGFTNNLSPRSDSFYGTDIYSSPRYLYDESDFGQTLCSIEGENKHLHTII